MFIQLLQLPRSKANVSLGAITAPSRLGRHGRENLWIENSFKKRASRVQCRRLARIGFCSLALVDGHAQVNPEKDSGRIRKSTKEVVNPSPETMLWLDGELYE